jgi:hypothetical protein
MHLCVLVCFVKCKSVFVSNLWLHFHTEILNGVMLCLCALSSTALLCCCYAACLLLLGCELTRLYELLFCVRILKWFQNIVYY